MIVFRAAMTRAGDAIETRPHHTRMPRFQKIEAGRAFGATGQRFAAIAVLLVSAVAGLSVLPL